MSSASNDPFVVRDLIVIGASAGGVQAIEHLVSKLEPDLPAAIMVVIHLPADPPSVLPHIIERACRLPATHAKDGDCIEIGRIYVAPPDRHLMIERGRVRVVRGPRENGYRPAVDALFRTAARAYGPQVIGVVLTGSLDDGTAGLRAIKQRGGLAVVQDPADAFSAGMPRSAMQNVEIDYCVPLAEIAPLLMRLLNERVRTEALAAMADTAGNGSAFLGGNDDTREQDLMTHFSCPECNGVLHELDNGHEYRCRVGHLYSPEALLSAQGNGVEAALWAAVRSLEESATLARRIGSRFGRRQMERFESRAAGSERYAALVRRMLTHGVAGQTHPAEDARDS
jgi:two-component system chemotaxis response regulator CheB